MKEPTSEDQVSLLDLQSEQLARKLQEEDGAENIDSPPVPSFAEETVASKAHINPQGAWVNNAAAVLRASNASPQEASSPAPEQADAGTTAPLGESRAPVDAASLENMVNMGVQEDWAAAALRRCGGTDVAMAVEFCFSHDMAALATEDALHVASSTQDIDRDFAFAMALEEEERQAVAARDRARESMKHRGVEEGTFGSKVKVGVPGYSGVARGKAKDRRWCLADVEDIDAQGQEIERKPSDRDDDGDDDTVGGSEDDAKGDAVEGRRRVTFSIVPGGGRRKGKMPLFRNANGDLVSKHDSTICGRMNAREASNLDGVGDLTAAGVRLDNRTFNSLKKDIRRKKEKGMSGGQRVELSTRATQEGVMDPRTRLLVFKMVNAGTLLEVHGMVKTGKEAHVYHALAPEDANNVTPLGVQGGSRAVALKIFKTTLNEFGNRAAYVDGDPRYAGTKFNKLSRRKMFGVWAKKEHRNLIRLHRAGVPCPEPLVQREHTLVMSFIGEEFWPAPQLRELDLSPQIWRRCYAQVLDLMRAMFRQCRLVHADLSDYNILYYKKVCYVIDVGQAVDVGHEKAREYLRRDIRVVSDFFRHKGVEGCLTNELAEVFVLLYAGPCEHQPPVPQRRSEENQEQYHGEAIGGDKPKTGSQLALELMQLNNNQTADDALQRACKAAEKWAAREKSGQDVLDDHLLEEDAGSDPDSDGCDGCEHEEMDLTDTIDAIESLETEIGDPVTNNLDQRLEKLDTTSQPEACPCTSNDNLRLSGTDDEKLPIGHDALRVDAGVERDGLSEEDWEIVEAGKCQQDDTEASSTVSIERA